jgi:L-lactate dehydrogenase complex protein LldE
MKVTLFATCLVDQFYPEVGMSVVRLLRRLGCEVRFPDSQTCCGQPAFNAGFADEARRVARGLLDALEGADYVVSPSGSCVGMIHHYYPELFAHDRSLSLRVAELKRRTFEFSQFLVNVLKVTDVGAHFPHRVTYHPSCHGVRFLNIGEEPFELLRSVREIDLVPLPHAEDCCGFGGTFAVKMSRVSEGMVEEKVQNILSTGARYVIGTDMACLMNIGGYLKKQGIEVEPLHLAELLDRGLRGEAGE